jgi:hypothetical protein
MGVDDLDPFLEAIGRVTAAAGALDYHVAFLYATLIESNLGAIAAVGQSFQTNLAGCRAITRYHRERPESGVRYPLDDDIDEILRAAEEVYKQRNNVVHGWWRVTPDDVVHRRSYQARRWHIELNPRTWTVDDLRKLALELDTVKSALGDLVVKCRDGYNRKESD